jgi:hypothetical protein
MTNVGSGDFLVAAVFAVRPIGSGVFFGSLFAR